MLLVFGLQLSVVESVHLLPHSEAARWVPKFALADSVSAPTHLGEHATRPLPTPCRSRMPPLTYGGQASAAALVPTPAPGPSDLDRCLAEEIAAGTLLTQAAQHSDEWAFLAATLLDTLLEHGVDGDCGARTPCCSAGQPIALAQHLPRHSSHDLTQVAFTAGLGPDEATSLLKQGVWSLRTDIPDTLHGCPGFQTGPACGPTHLQYEALHVYTDGSFSGNVSSWAFAVFGLRSGTLTWLGWDGGQVVTDASHAHYVGATHHSALCGEQCALAWATSWALQAIPGMPVAFFADCQVRQTTGRYGSVAPLGLASVCRSLFQALQAARPELDPHISHIRSHTGHLPNEIVDVLAKFLCKAELCERDYSPHLCVVARWCRSPQLPWLWLSFAALRQPAQWPTPTGRGYIDRHRLVTQTPPATATCCGYFGLAQTDPAASPACRFTAQLCIFNLNVQSLAEVSADDGSSSQCPFPGRAAFLREQFDYYGAHIVALQEARSSADSMFVSATHVRLCTGRDKQGNFGVELWFSRRHPFARIGDTELIVEPGDLLTLQSDPRILIVRYSRGPLRILFVSLHAPGATHPHRNAWWSTFQTRLGRLYGGEAVVLLGDFNTHFSVALGEHVGDLVFPSHHAVPESLSRILHRHNLWIPSTFSICHAGPSETWWPPGGGAGARLDYAAIPCDWQVAPSGSEVFSALDWGQARDDHHALRTWVTFHDFASQRVRARRPAYDRNAMLTDLGRTTLQSIFAQVPTVEWDQNVHQHFATLQQYVVNSLAVAFPAAKTGCRSSHFSPYTWQLRQRRVWLRKRIVALRPRVLQIALRGAFCTWRLSRPLRVSCTIQALRSGTQLCHLVSYIQELTQTKLALRQAIRTDIATRIHDAARDATALGTGDVVSRLQCLLGPPKRKVRPQRGLPGILKGDGSPAVTPEEVEATWIQHFSSIEAGRPCSPQELVARCVCRQRTAILMISRSDRETFPPYRKSKGPSGIPCYTVLSAPMASLQKPYMQHPEQPPWLSSHFS